MRSHPIVDFDNFSPDTLKMADILHNGLRCGKVCLGGYNLTSKQNMLCCQRRMVSIQELITLN